MNPFPIEIEELEPVRRDNQGIGLLGNIINISAAYHCRECRAGSGHGPGIVCPDLRTGLRESLEKLDGGGTTDVVRICFVGKAKQTNPFAHQHPQRSLNFLQEKIEPPTIHFPRRLENSSVHTRSL